jgi:hypothetical protein
MFAELAADLVDRYDRVFALVCGNAKDHQDVFSRHASGWHDRSVGTRR